MVYFKENSKKGEEIAHSEGRLSRSSRCFATKLPDNTKMGQLGRKGNWVLKAFTQVLSLNEGIIKEKGGEAH